MTIPARKAKTYSTSAENQSGVEIHVLQGERQFASDSKGIGKFKLDDIPPAPRGVPQIEVRFDIDANGFLHVVAKDLGTSREQKIAITASRGLSKAEIERMRKDDELHAEEERNRKAEMEVPNEAENLVYRAEKALKEIRGKLSEANRGKLGSALNEARGAIKGRDSAAIIGANEKLSKIWQRVSKAVNQADGEKAPAGQARAARVNARGRSRSHTPHRMTPGKPRPRSWMRELWARSKLVAVTHVHCSVVGASETKQTNRPRSMKQSMGDRFKGVHPEVRVGHVHLKVADLGRALAFYHDVLGFALTQRFGSQAAFLAAGGYHHHIGLNTWESQGGAPPPPGATGLYHIALVYPNRAELADALRRLIQEGIHLDGAADHGVSEALYLRDPDGNGVELYWDRPKEAWPRTAEGELNMGTRPLDLAALLKEAPDRGPVAGKASSL